MEMPQDRVNAILAPLAARIIPLFEAGQLKKSEPNFWAAKAILNFCTGDCFDRGIFSIYLLNLLHLQQGEGVFQPAGMLHAYLEGQNLEVMANSDNVLRAGLTDKHVDVAELMQHTSFLPTYPVIINSKEPEDGVIKVPAEEFALAHFRLNSPYTFHSEGAEILLVLEGRVQLGRLRLDRGEAAFIFANTEVTAEPLGTAELYRVFSPKKGDQN
jgi:mannose-6-phosphate isomerase